jgi:hypothetical protein
MQKKNIKSFQTRIPVDVWEFLRDTAFKRKASMNEIINELIINYKIKCEKVLTNKDTIVSYDL